MKPSSTFGPIANQSGSCLSMKPVRQRNGPPARVQPACRTLPGLRAACVSETITLIAGLRSDGLSAPIVFDGTLDGEKFNTYAGTILAPKRGEGDIDVLGKSNFSQSRRRREAIEANGTTKILPPEIQPRDQSN